MSINFHAEAQQFCRRHSLTDVASIEAAMRSIANICLADIVQRLIDLNKEIEDLRRLLGNPPYKPNIQLSLSREKPEPEPGQLSSTTQTDKQ